MKKEIRLKVFAFLLIVFQVNVAIGYNAISNNAYVQEMAAPNIEVINIDGELVEWSDEDGTLIANDNNAEAQYRALVFLAATNSGLYASAKVSDPTPLNNGRNGSQGESAWNGDAVQLRLSANVNTLLNASLQTQNRPTNEQDSRISHLTFWFDARQQRVHFHQAIGMEFNGNALDPEGVEGAYKLDKKGYHFEYLIPWAQLNFPERPQVESFIQGQWQIHWGDGTGLHLERGITDLRPKNNFKDLSYHGPRSWGVIRFVEKLERNDSFAKKSDEKGELEIPLEFPATHFKTQNVQILNESGRLIRTLFTGSTSADLFWDGYDDLGQPVLQGGYRARRLLHNGINPEWQCSLGNSGNPSWRQADGSGSQFGNYGMPLHLENTQYGMLLGTGKSEAAPSLVMMNEDGSYLWGSISFTQQPIAVDSNFVYQWQKDEANIARFELASGIRLDTVSLPQWPKEFNAESVTKIALAESTVLILSDGILWYSDLNNLGQTATQLGISDIKDFVFSDDETLWLAAHDDLYKVALNEIGRNELLQFSYSGIVAMDSYEFEGRLLFALALKDHTVVIVDAKGNLLSRIGGTPRHLVGSYDVNTLYEPINVSFSGEELWVAENHMAPKRFSVWSLEGKFKKEIFGSITYSPAAWWDSTDANVVYGGWGRYLFDQKNNSCKYDGGIISPKYYSHHIKLPVHSAPTYFMHDKRRFAAVKQWSRFMYFKELDGELVPIKLIEPRRYELDMSLTADGNPRQLDANSPFLYNVDEKGNLWAIEGFGYAHAQRVVEHNEPYRIGLVRAEKWLNAQSFNELQFEWRAMDERGGSVADLYADSDGSLYTLVSNGDIKRGQDVPAASHRIVKFDANGDIAWVYEDVELAFAWNSSTCESTRVCAAMGFTRGNSDRYIGVTGYYGQYFLIDKNTGLFVTSLGEDQRSDFSYGPHMIFTENFNGTLHQGDDGEVYFFAGDVDARMWRLAGINNQKIEEIIFQVTTDIPKKNQVILASEPSERVVLNNDDWHYLDEENRFRIYPYGSAWYIEFDVKDESAFINSASDERFYFSHGDAIDIQFGVYIELEGQDSAISREAQLGDKRLIVTSQGALLLERSESGYLYQSPTGEFGPVSFENIHLKNKLIKTRDGYYLRLSLPQDLFGDQDRIAFDVGIIFGDSAGRFSKRRVMWADRSAKIGINNDVPSQASFRLGRGVLDVNALRQN